MSGANKQKKPENAVVYEYGALLLKDLEKSGYELITGPYCDTAFFFQQVESALREKVEEFGEKIESFKTVLSDFSSLNLPQYRIDLSALSSFSEYDRIEMEQWGKEGWAPEELIRLRYTYLFGEWRTASIKNGVNSNNYWWGDKAGIIDSLSVDFSQIIAQIAIDNEIPLYTVISIFYGLILNDHNELELIVKNDKSNYSIDKIYEKIALKIHDYWIECISFIALLNTIELLKINSFRYPKKGHEYSAVCPEEVKFGERNLLFCNCLNLCQEIMFREMTNGEIDIYINDRYSYVRKSYDIFMFFILEYISNKIKKFNRTAVDLEEIYLSNQVYGDITNKLAIDSDGSVIFSSSESEYCDEEIESSIKINRKEGYYEIYDATDSYKNEYGEIIFENYEIGLELAGKFISNSFLKNYYLQGNKNYILGYLLKIFDNVVIGMKKKNEYQLNNGNTISTRTLRRYKNEHVDKLTREKIEELYDDKKNNMLHCIPGLSTKGSIIKEIFIKGYSYVVDLVPEFPKLKFTAYRNRLNKLEKEEILMHDATGIDGRTKYYFSSKDNVVNIAKLIASIKDNRKKL